MILKPTQNKTLFHEVSKSFLHFKVFNYPSVAVVALAAEWHTALALNKLKTLPLPL